MTFYKWQCIKGGSTLQVLIHDSDLLPTSIFFPCLIAFTSKSDPYLISAFTRVCLETLLTTTRMCRCYMPSDVGKEIIIWWTTFCYRTMWNKITIKAIAFKACAEYYLHFNGGERGKPISSLAPCMYWLCIDAVTNMASSHFRWRKDSQYQEIWSLSA